MESIEHTTLEEATAGHSLPSKILETLRALGASSDFSVYKVWMGWRRKQWRSVVVVSPPRSRTLRTLLGVAGFVARRKADDRVADFVWRGPVQTVTEESPLEVDVRDLGVVLKMIGDGKERVNASLDIESARWLRDALDGAIAELTHGPTPEFSDPPIESTPPRPVASGHLRLVHTARR